MKLADIIRDYNARGHKLMVEWDAGGDQTIVYALDPDEPSSKPLRAYVAIQTALEYIRDELGLPNAGEHYHQGRGELKLDESGRPLLEFDSRDYYINEAYYWEEGENAMRGEMLFWGEGDERNIEGPIRRPAVIENHPLIESFLHRVDVVVYGEMDRHGNKNAQLRFRIVDGDEVEIPEEVRDFYAEQMLAVLDDCSDLMIPPPNREGPAGLYLEAALRMSGEVEVRATTDAYDLFRIHQSTRLSLEEIE